MKKSAPLSALFVLLLVLFGPVGKVAAQQAGAAATGTITGSVTDNTGEALPGVNVVIDGTNTGGATDLDGNFKITGVKPGTYTLAATYIGYARQQKENVTVKAGQTVEVDFVMQEQTWGLDEVVVIGYGTMKREDLTGAVGSVDVEKQAQNMVVTNVTQMLQGRVAGLNAGLATGASGETGLSIRGKNSIAGTDSPLIVIDGVRFTGSMADINPSDIASIDVLKGASAAAVYGASSAAGVVEITTKKGASQKPTINFKSSVGVATRGNYIEPYGVDGYIHYRRDAAIRQNPNRPANYYADPNALPEGVTLDDWLALGNNQNATVSPMEIYLSRIGLSQTEVDNFVAGNSINWTDEVVRTEAIRQDYNVSISGRPQDVQYYLSLGYTDNEGETIGSKFQAIRGRANIDADVTSWLKVGLNSQYGNRNGSFLGADWGAAETASPLGSKYEEDGSLKWYPHDDNQARNPFLATTESGRRRQNTSNNLIANLSADLRLPGNFDLTVRWANDLDWDRTYDFTPHTHLDGQPLGNASRSETLNYEWQLDNILNWRGNIGRIHEFDATFLFNLEAQNSWYTSASNSKFSLDYLGYSGLFMGTEPVVGSDDWRASGTAMMGRVNYRLLDRYLVTATLRRDGYSAFGRNQPYAYFPSLALAWRLSEEPFFKNDLVSNLKLRTSWGVNGNRSIGTYSALQRLKTNEYQYGGQTVIGIWAENLPNNDLKWERTTQYNAGFDFGLFNERISGTVEGYIMQTDNMLLNRQLPDVTSYPSIITNLGRIDNTGLEVTLNTANIQQKDLNWTSTFTLSTNKNEIKDLYGDGSDDRKNGWYIGRPLDVVYDYQQLGVYTTEEAEAAAIYGKQPGDFKLLDVNGDSLLTPVEDKVFLGHTDPDFRLSFSNDVRWKNFTVSAMIYAALGQLRSHNSHKHVGYLYGRVNRKDYPYWTPENQLTDWARLDSKDNPGFSYWENSSFVRLNDLSISYRIPSRWVGRFAGKEANVFFNAQNLFVITGFDGEDPASGGNAPRLYSVGVNLSF